MKFKETLQLGWWKYWVTWYISMIGSEISAQYRLVWFHKSNLKCYIYNLSLFHKEMSSLWLLVFYFNQLLLLGIPLELYFIIFFLYHGYVHITLEQTTLKSLLFLEIFSIMYAHMHVWYMYKSMNKILKLHFPQT